MLIQCITNSFRSEMLQAIHDLSTDTLKLALYTGTANLYPTTTAYTATDEVVASGYTAGGEILTGVTITTGLANTTQPSVVYVTFNNPSWTSALTARGGLIYNFSKANRSVAVLDFGADKTSTTTFTIQLPAASPTTALLRFP